MSGTIDWSVVDTIFLDVDDALNSLTLPIMKHFGVDVGPYEYDAFPSEVGYDVLTAVNLLMGLEGTDKEWTLKEFWEAIPLEVWRDAPLSKESQFLLQRSAQLVGMENVFLATTPTKCPDSHAAKVIWINENLPEWIHRQYFITPRKWKLANREAVLIDDHDENIQLFCEKGQGIVVPRPWNSHRHLHTMGYLVEQLGELE